MSGAHRLALWIKSQPNGATSDEAAAALPPGFCKGIRKTFLDVRRAARYVTRETVDPDGKRRLYVDHIIDLSELRRAVYHSSSRWVTVGIHPKFGEFVFRVNDDLQKAGFNPDSVRYAVQEGKEYAGYIWIRRKVECVN